MGERKGQNHYYPPDFNWRVHKTLNRYHGVHALRERGARAHEGIITIRFEMPFNVWCLGCNNHIAMSVRYNAEKRKVGMYYTTPIYEFHMKCHLCDNYFTIRTDPKNFDYELVEGLRRQEIRFDPSTIDNFAPVDRTMSLKLGADAMFKAEHTVEDKQKLAGADQQIQRLEDIQTRLYDDYGANAVLRGTFRREKKCFNEKRSRDQAIKKRLSTEITLLPENKEDKLAAQRLALSKHLLADKIDEKLTKEKLMKSPMLFPTFSEATSSSDQQATVPPSPNSGNTKQLLSQKVHKLYIEDALNGERVNGKKQSKRCSLGISLNAQKRTKNEVNSNANLDIGEVVQENDNANTKKRSNSADDEKSIVLLDESRHFDSLVANYDSSSSDSEDEGSTFCNTIK